MEEEVLWGLGITEGVIALLFGIAAVFWPGITIVTLIYLFSVFILVSGIVNLIAGIFRASAGFGSWLMRLILAFVQIGVGVYLLRHPHVGFAALVLLIGFTLIIRGIFEIVGAFMDDLSGGARVLYVITGFLALIIGIYMLFQPVSGGVAFVWALGLYALIAGPMLIATALRYRKLVRHVRSETRRA